MDNFHIQRIVQLLDDPKPQLFLYYLRTECRYTGTAPHQIWKHQLHWKWFLRDIGKQSCIIGLVPFLEIAKHMYQTPIVSRSHNSCDEQLESSELFHKKVELIKRWALHPSKSAKQEILQILPPAKHYLKYDLKIAYHPPHRTAVAFVNLLILIIVGERHFQNRVFAAIRSMNHMGYSDWYTSHQFLQNVLEHYKELQLNV